MSHITTLSRYSTREKSPYLLAGFSVLEGPSHHFELRLETAPDEPRGKPTVDECLLVEVHENFLDRGLAEHGWRWEQASAGWGFDFHLALDIHSALAYVPRMGIVSPRSRATLNKLG